jgi:hypothetical protein
LQGGLTLCAAFLSLPRHKGTNELLLLYDTNLKYSSLNRAQVKFWTTAIVEACRTLTHQAGEMRSTSSV